MSLRCSERSPCGSTRNASAEHEGQGRRLLVVHLVRRRLRSSLSAKPQGRRRRDSWRSTQQLLLALITRVLDLTFQGRRPAETAALVSFREKSSRLSVKSISNQKSFFQKVSFSVRSRFHLGSGSSVVKLASVLWSPASCVHGLLSRYS